MGRLVNGNLVGLTGGMPGKCHMFLLGDPGWRPAAIVAPIPVLQASSTGFCVDSMNRVQDKRQRDAAVKLLCAANPAPKSKVTLRKLSTTRIGHDHPFLERRSTGYAWPDVFNYAVM